MLRMGFWHASRGSRHGYTDVFLQEEAGEARRNLAESQFPSRAPCEASHVARPLLPGRTARVFVLHNASCTWMETPHS